jgi:hypothetical protein
MSSKPEKPAENSTQKLASKLQDFYAARDAVTEARDAPVDRVELWGRRFGRGLGAIGFLALLYWFFHQIYFR